MKPATRKKLLALAVLAGVLVVAVMMILWEQQRNATRLVPLPEKQQLTDGSWMEICYIGYGRKQCFLTPPPPTAIFDRLGVVGDFLVKQINKLPDPWAVNVYLKLFLFCSPDDDEVIKGEKPFLYVIVDNKGGGEMPDRLVDLTVFSGLNFAGETNRIHESLWVEEYSPGEEVGAFSWGFLWEWRVDGIFPADQEKIILRFIEKNKEDGEGKLLAEFTVDNPAYAGGR